MRLSNIILLICMSAALVVLVTLGNWQMDRLEWKEDLIKRVNARLDLPPVPLLEMLEKNTDLSDHEYSPVQVRGEFDHEKEVYYFTTDSKGASGWNVYTPLKLNNGKILIVNRGFVLFPLRDASSRSEGQITGEIDIQGLLRLPLAEKPSASYDNNLEKREFYWRSHEEMAGLMGDDQSLFLPVFVDADDAANPGGWPKGGATKVSFTNNHLQYAVTWYGLAVTLLGVGGFFLYSRRRETNE